MGLSAKKDLRLVAGEVLQHLAAKRYEEAHDCIRRALATDPDCVEILQLQAAVELARGDSASAVASLRRASGLPGAGADCHKDLARALAVSGELPEACEVASRACEAFPCDSETRELAAIVFAHMGAEEARSGRYAAAVSAYGNALRFRPGFPEAQINLGNALAKLGRYPEALDAFDAARDMAPEFAEAEFNRGAVLLELGLAQEALAAQRAAARTESGFVRAASAVLYVSLFTDGDRGDVVWREHRNWVERFAADSRTNYRGARDASSERRLRIGYLSRFQASRFFLHPLLASHRHDEFEIICYVDVDAPDEQLEPVISLPGQWKRVAHLNSAGLAALIEQDEIDILVDWTGHSSSVRPLVLARKPAPVQVSMSGYPASTGLPSVDYRITDPIADPPGVTEKYHSEELVRLEPCFCCYHPPEGAPDVGQLPAGRNGHVTFGSFNKPAKITDEVLAAWAAVLRACPHSELLMQYAFGAAKAVPVEYRDRISAAFRAYDVDPARVRFIGARPPAERLELLNEVDISLDPFPYNGATTTCETLWMGVPAVVLAGSTHVSRVGASMLSAVGLTDWVARSKDAYVALAVTKAADRDGLRRLRAELRPRMASSMLTNGPAYTRALEQKFRSMWRRWCEGRRTA